MYQHAEGVSLTPGQLADLCLLCRVRADLAYVRAPACFVGTDGALDCSELSEQ